MEAVAYVAGEAHSDHPLCACPVISEFLRSWNDDLSDGDRKRLLGGFVFRLVGTKSTKKIEERRVNMALEWLIRVFIPDMLDLTPSLQSHATALRKIRLNSAAISAARSAAISALAPTVKKLKRSAQRLVDLMIRLTEPRRNRHQERRRSRLLAERWSWRNRHSRACRQRESCQRHARQRLSRKLGVHAGSAASPAKHCILWRPPPHASRVRAASRLSR